MTWDFTQYNQVVKHVEGCSDHLRKIALNMPVSTSTLSTGTITCYRNKTAERLRSHLLQAIRELDRRALRMLALYDPAAHEMVRTGVEYDERRDMFKPESERRSASANAPEPKRIAAPRRAPTQKKKTRRTV